MPVTQDRLTRLREFGLSEYGARAYLALLDLGIAEARDVSSISKVPQAKIYHVLEQLHEKGLVVILPEFPKKYAPVPFEEYLQRLYDEHTKQAQAIEAERETLAEMFRVMGETNVGDRGFFTVIRGRRNVLAKVEEMIASARRDILVLGTAGGTARMAHFLPEIKAAVGRSVDVRLLLPIDKESLTNASLLGEVADVRARDATGDERADKVAIVVVDATTAFLIHFVPDDANLYAGKDIGVFTDQEAMVAAIQAIVDPHWSRATRLDRRRDEILTGRAPESTRVHTSRESVREALESALANATLEIRVVDSTAEAVANTDALLAMLAAHAAPARVILNLADDSSLDAVRKVVTGRHEARHLRPRLATRHVIVDGREAFVWLGAGAAGEGLVVETNSPGVIVSLGAHFETLWRAASSLDERRDEIEALPESAPVDFAVGRLLVLLGESFFALDRDWRVVYTNPVADRIRTRAKDEVIGRNLWDAFPELRDTAFYREYHRAMEEGVPVRFEEQWPRTGRWFEASAIPTADGLSIFFRDVTDRRQSTTLAASTQARFQALLAATGVATALASPDGRVLASNGAFVELAGRVEDLAKAFPDAWPSLAGMEEGSFSIEAEMDLPAGRTKVRLQGRALKADGAREILLQVTPGKVAAPSRAAQRGTSP